MSFHPDDLITDQDLVDYESEVLETFGATTWIAKRTKACEDWLYPILTANGFDPLRLKTRFDPDVVWGYTSSAYSDLTAACKNTTAADIDLAAVFATPGSDALYIGSTAPQRGLYLRLTDSVSSASSVLTAAYWNGAWTTHANVEDRTIAATGKTLSRGGAVRWTLPPDATVRKINGSDLLYWTRLTVSAVPTGADADQIAVVRSSALRGALAFRTLYLILIEAPTSQDGPWLDKAERYREEADIALQRALAQIGGEFDLDESEQISTTEADNTVEEAGGQSAVILERA